MTKEEIHNILFKLGIKKYSIRTDNMVNVYQDVVLINIDKIPVNFNYVGGNFYCSDNNQLTSLDGAPNNVGGDFYCYDNPNLPYSELFKIVDNVKCNIYYSSFNTLEDKDKIRRDRDVKATLKDDELGSLDV